MKKFILVLILCLLAIPAVTLAGGSSDENVFIPKEQVISDNYFVIGNTVDISGTLEKDAYIIGQNVVISGTIKGDLIGVANSLRIDGVVEGNVRFLASEMDIKGEVYKNITVASGNLVVLGKLNQDLIGAVGSADLQGEMLGNVNLVASKVNVDKNIAGNLSLRLDENGTMSFAEEVEIGGNLAYSPIKKEVEGLSGVTVVGETKLLKINKSLNINKAYNYIYLYSRIAYFLSLLMIVLVMLSFMKKFTVQLSSLLAKEPLRCFNKGFWFVILVPLVCLLLLFTLVGLPLAGILMALYIIVFYISKIFVGLAVGMVVLKQDFTKAKLIWPAVLGVFLVVIGVSIPFIGFLVNLLLTSAGFGALYIILKREK